jgi:glycosyltransferase involved in cell wall biosynthesis
LRYPIAWIFRWLEPLLARLQSALIFSDDAIAKSFEGIGSPKVTLFNYPSIDFVEAAKSKTQESFPKNALVLHLGGHERNRGTELMIEAFSMVIRNRPDSHLLLVGHFVPPELETEVREHIHAQGLDEKVTITGRVPFEEIGNYLSQAAVGWVPWQAYLKNKKNIPTKLFEYMAYAVPIVASDLASIKPFVLDNQNGFRVKPADSLAHASAILRILGDPKLGRELGAQGQEFAQNHYNWNSEEKKLLGLYRSLIGQYSE